MRENKERMILACNMLLQPKGCLGSLYYLAVMIIYERINILSKTLLSFKVHT